MKYEVILAWELGKENAEDLRREKVLKTVLIQNKRVILLKKDSAVVGSAETHGHKCKVSLVSMVV